MYIEPNQPIYVQQQPQYIMQQPMQQQYIVATNRGMDGNNSKSYVQGQPILQAQSYPIDMHNNYNQNSYHQGNGFNYQQGEGLIVNSSNFYQREYPNNANGAFGPSRINCPFCKSEITTTMETASGMGTWTACCLLFCLTGWCCCLPFFIDDCKDKIFKCPKCKQIVGIREYKIL